METVEGDHGAGTRLGVSVEGNVFAAGLSEKYGLSELRMDHESSYNYGWIEVEQFRSREEYVLRRMINYDVLRTDTLRFKQLSCR
jgi:hypothetical protein